MNYPVQTDKGTLKIWVFIGKNLHCVNKEYQTSVMTFCLVIIFEQPFFNGCGGSSGVRILGTILRVSSMKAQWKQSKMVPLKQKMSLQFFSLHFNCCKKNCKKPGLEFCPVSMEKLMNVYCQSHMNISLELVNV